MIILRRSEDRGHFDHGWLNTYHTFSFSSYHDDRFLGFRNLRVINEDIVAAGEGFPPHGHQSMEIITYILQGALEHKDSMGSGSVIRPGDVQRMSAGAGVTHSEFNASSTEPVHLLQIWILPAKRGGAPGYEEKRFSHESRQNQLTLIASEDGEAGSVKVQQSVKIYASLLDAQNEVNYEIAEGRYAWLQLARGSIIVQAGSSSEVMKAGDGLAVSLEQALKIKSQSDSEFLLFDLN